MICCQRAEHRALFDQQTLARAERSERRSARSASLSFEDKILRRCEIDRCRRIKGDRHSYKLLDLRHMPAMCRAGIFIAQ